MKKVDENTDNQHDQGLSIFNMEFASKGLSWAENIYQKLESVNLDNIISQTPSSYIDAFGERFRRICEEVDDWINPCSDVSIKSPVSDLSVELEVIANVCQMSKLKQDEDLINEEAAVDMTLGTSVSSGDSDNLDGSSERDTGLDSSIDMPQDSCSEEASNVPCESLIPFPVAGSVCCSNVDTDSHENTVAWTADVSNDRPSADAAHESNFDGNKIEISLWASSIEGNRASPTEGHEKMDSSALRTNLSIGDNVPCTNAEKEEFEDLQLQEHWFELGDDELLSKRTKSNLPYRKKLKNAFRSMTWSPKKKGSELVLAFPDSPGSTKMSDTTNLAIKDSCDSDWELL